MRALATDEALERACERLRGPLPPPAALGVPVAHERAVALVGLLSRQMVRLREERTIEAKLELVNECWRVILIGTRPWSGSDRHSSDAGPPPASSSPLGMAEAATPPSNAEDAQDGSTSNRPERGGSADLLPTAAVMDDQLCTLFSALRPSANARDDATHPSTIAHRTVVTNRRLYDPEPPSSRESESRARVGKRRAARATPTRRH